MNTPQADRSFNRADAVVLCVAAAVLVLFRLHAYPAPLESDECNYTYFAQRLLAGDRLYVDLWDHQPPGIFAFLVLPTAVLGSTPAVYRTLALAASLITLALLFDLSRRCFGRAAAWTAAILFALVSSDPGTGGEGCNREIYINVLLCAAAWALLGGDAGLTRKQFYGRVLVAGALLGIASVFKTVVAAHWLALWPAVLLVHRHRKPDSDAAPMEPRRRDWLLLSAAWAAGPALVWLLTWGYFAATSRSQEFIDAVFTSNLTYGGAGPRPLRRPIVFFLNPNVFRTTFALWVAGAVGLILLRWKRDLPRSLGLAMFLLGSYVAVCLPGRFWPHYFYLMLPPLVVLSAGLVQRISGFERRLGAAAAGTLALALLATQIPGYLLVPPDLIGWDRYRTRMAWARDQARRVAEVTDPRDTIYVWSADAGFYYYSGRRCASRYTMYLPLIGDDAGSAARRRQLIEDLTRSMPRLMLMPYRPFPELNRFMEEHRYVVVGRDEKLMQVLCPLDRPIPEIDWSWESPYNVEALTQDP